MISEDGAFRHSLDKICYVSLYAFCASNSSKNRKFMRIYKLVPHYTATFKHNAVKIRCAEYVFEPFGIIF